MAYKLVAVISLIIFVVSGSAIEYKQYNPTDGPEKVLLQPIPVLKAIPVHQPYAEDDYKDSPAEYEFTYGVHDDHTKDIKMQKETRKGDAVHGSYELIDSDGYKRIVTYTADDHNGFQAVVHREKVDIQVPIPEQKQYYQYQAFADEHHNNFPAKEHVAQPESHYEGEHNQYIAVIRKAEIPAKPQPVGYGALSPKYQIKHSSPKALSTVAAVTQHSYQPQYYSDADSQYHSGSDAKTSQHHTVVQHRYTQPVASVKESQHYLPPTQSEAAYAGTNKVETPSEYLSGPKEAEVQLYASSSNQETNVVQKDNALPTSVLYSSTIEHHENKQKDATSGVGKDHSKSSEDNSHVNFQSSDASYQF